MKLAMEIPKAHLHELSPLCDADFALAHFVLEDKEYADFYKEQSRKGQLVILDNSFHELGVPLGAGELRAAARAINPTVVVAPDKLKHTQWNWDQFSLTQKLLGTEFKTGIVVTGNDFAERFKFIDAALSRGCEWFFWPFKEDRFSWICEAWPNFSQLQHRKHHLLGVSTLAELTCCRQFFEGKHVSVSYDTAKPIKFGRLNQRFHPGLELRGAGLLDHDVKLNDWQIRDVFYNIAYMRRFSG